MSTLGQKIVGILNEVEGEIPSSFKLIEAVLQEALGPDDYATKGVKIIEDLAEDMPAIVEAWKATPAPAPQPDTVQGAAQ